MEQSPITITMNWRQDESDVDPERQERQTEVLYRELRQLDEVDVVSRVADPNVPDGGLGAAWLWSVLQAEVSVENIGVVYKLVRDRIPGPPMDIEVSNGDRKILIKGVRPEAVDATLEKVVAAAKELGND